MGFSRQEYWSGLPFPSPRDLPDPGVKPKSPALEDGLYTTKPPERPLSASKSEVKLLSCVWLFSTPWTVACQAPSSMEFSRQGNWSGFPINILPSCFDYVFLNLIGQANVTGLMTQRLRLGPISACQTRWAHLAMPGHHPTDPARYWFSWTECCLLHFLNVKGSLRWFGSWVREKQAIISGVLSSWFLGYHLDEREGARLHPVRLFGSWEMSALFSVTQPCIEQEGPEHLLGPWPRVSHGAAHDHPVHPSYLLL